MIILVFFLSVGDSYRILTQISYIPAGLRWLWRTGRVALESYP